MAGTVRGQGFKSPRDLTGRKHQELLRAKAAKDAAEKFSLSALEQSRLAGFDDGWAAAERFYLPIIEAIDVEETANG